MQLVPTMNKTLFETISGEELISISKAYNPRKSNFWAKVSHDALEACFSWTPRSEVAITTKETKQMGRLMKTEDGYVIAKKKSK